MFKTILWCAVGLAAAAAIPMGYFHVFDALKGGQKGASSSAGQAGDPNALPTGVDLGVPQIPSDPRLAVEGTAPGNLGEVLTFDATPDWIMRRWPRVSTGLAELQLQGYRVPLVTGTRESDLAGALTYYFNPRQQVQRITFRGSTGDARGLVMLLTSRYRFTRRLTNDPALVVYEAAQPGGKVQSVLRLRSSPVVKASEAHRRFDVELAIERPES